MQDGVTGDENPETTGSGDNDAPATVESNAEMPSGARATDTSKRKTLVIGGLAAAAMAFTAIGFGAASLIRNHIDTAAAAAIPTPPSTNQMFVEDDDGTGADSQENILQSTVPGLVHITSARGSGTGVVLTPSGLVLTSAQVAAGHGTIVAKMLPSGHVYPATVVGSDGKLPLVLYHFVGAGKAMFHAFDDTWRWRFRAARCSSPGRNWIPRPTISRASTSRWRASTSGRQRVRERRAAWG